MDQPIHGDGASIISEWMLALVGGLVTLTFALAGAIASYFGGQLEKLHTRVSDARNDVDDHISALRTDLAQHDRRLTAVERDCTHLHQCVHETREIGLETRDTVQRIAGALGVSVERR